MDCPAKLRAIVKSSNERSSLTRSNQRVDVYYPVSPSYSNIYTVLKLTNSRRVPTNSAILTSGFIGISRIARYLEFPLYPQPPPRPFEEILRVSNLRPPRIRRPSVILASPRPLAQNPREDLTKSSAPSNGTSLNPPDNIPHPLNPNEEFEVTWLLLPVSSNPFRTKLEEIYYNCSPIYCSTIKEEF